MDTEKQGKPTKTPKPTVTPKPPTVEEQILKAFKAIDDRLQQNSQAINSLNDALIKHVKTEKENPKPQKTDMMSIIKTISDLLNGPLGKVLEGMFKTETPIEPKIAPPTDDPNYKAYNEFLQKQRDFMLKRWEYETESLNLDNIRKKKIIDSDFWE